MPPCDVLELLVAQILERGVELAAHLPIGVVGDQHGAGIGDSLQAGRDVDAITEDVAVLDDDIADVHADAEFDAPVVGDVRIAFGHTHLHGNGATHGIDGAGELDQHAVAGGLDDTAGILGDLAVQELAAVLLQTRERTLLVFADEPAVASNIGREDGGQPPLNAILGHSINRPTPRS
jgi:hypothetical protein